MKAMVSNRYGSSEHLILSEIERPTPEPDNVLVKVISASLNKGDLHILRGEPFIIRLSGNGLFKPKNSIPGADIAGKVEAIGKQVSAFKPGDEVYADLSSSGWGGIAEYVSVPENLLALKPSNLSFNEAAAVPLAGVAAFQGLKLAGGIQSGQKILINGASGGLGTFAVQIAAVLGAEVNGVCAGDSLELVKSIGAKRVINYQKEDFTQTGNLYDLVFDAVGNHGLSEIKRSIARNGAYITSVFKPSLIFPRFSCSNPAGITMKNLMAKPDQKDLVRLKELIEAGKIKPVIDKVYNLKDTKEAFQHLENGHTRGKVVIHMV